MCWCYLETAVPLAFVLYSFVRPACSGWTLALLCLLVSNSKSKPADQTKHSRKKQRKQISDKIKAPSDSTYTTPPKKAFSSLSVYLQKRTMLAFSFPCPSRALHYFYFLFLNTEYEFEGSHTSEISFSLCVCFLGD